MLIRLDYDNSKRDDVIRRSNQLVFASAQVVSGERPRIHFVQLKHYLDRQVSLNFISNLELGAEFLRTIWNEQISAANWFDEETKNCIRFIKASNHDASMPLLLRYFQTNASDIPTVTKTIVAFFALWRIVFPTNSLPDIYRNLFSVNSAENMAHNGGTLKSSAALKAYFRRKLETRLGSPTSGKSYEDLWLEQQAFLQYDQLKTICRLCIFLDIGASIKSNLVPDDPWTVLDDIEHILPSSHQPAPININSIGNLTFLPPSVNKSIQAMAWLDKQEIYKLLASPFKHNPAPTQFPDGRPLPPAVQTYLGAPTTPALTHLLSITTNTNWDAQAIDARSSTILKNAWTVLYGTWLQ